MHYSPIHDEFEITKPHSRPLLLRAIIKDITAYEGVTLHTIKSSVGCMDVYDYPYDKSCSYLLTQSILLDPSIVTGSEKTRHICQTRIWRNARFQSKNIEVQFLSYS